MATIEQHAFLAPSSAGCTVHCAAAPRLQAQYPEDETNDAARRGQAVHWAGAEMFAGRDPRAGHLAPNGVILDNSMLESADMWFDYVSHKLSLFPEPWQEGLQVEQRMTGTFLHPTHNFGTPDSWAARRGPHPLLYIFVQDLKDGHGVVDVFENWQLINYASLILESLNVNGLDDQNIYFEFAIIQPRAYHIDGPIRTWTIKASDLRPYFNKLRAQYELATRADSPATPGPWCKTQYCSAAHACQALQRAAYGVVDSVKAAVARDLSASDVGRELLILEEAKALLDARYDGLKEQAKALILAGQRVPNYAIKAGKGRWKIKDEYVSNVIGMAQAVYGKDITKPPETYTPLQLRDKGIPEAALKPFTQEYSGENKLVRDTELSPHRVFSVKSLDKP